MDLKVGMKVRDAQGGVYAVEEYGVDELLVRSTTNGDETYEVERRPDGRWWALNDDGGRAFQLLEIDSEQTAARVARECADGLAGDVVSADALRELEPRTWSPKGDDIYFLRRELGRDETDAEREAFFTAFARRCSEIADRVGA